MYKSLFQTDWWAKFKETQGWQAAEYGPLLGLTRQLPLGRSFLYFPEIPLELDKGRPFEPMSYYLPRTKDTQPPSGRIFTRFEFLERWTLESAGQLIKSGLIKSFEEVQPEYRQWLDLTKSEAELLAEMKPKGRYNIKTAQRHDLKISWGINDQSINILYQLYRQTASRANFQGRSVNYFQQLAKLLQDHHAGDIIVVSKDNQPLAALLISFYDQVASYLYGGSGGDRSLMAPYLAHFEAIKRAKKKGCTLYDLLAIAPFQQQLSANADSRSSTKSKLERSGKLPTADSHRYSGLTRFKTQFGGESIRLLGSWDLVESPIWYTLYRVAEKYRRHI